MDKSRESLEHIYKLLRDVKVPDLQGELADDPLLVQINDELKAIREIMLAFSSGDFSPAITTRGIIPGCLKALQANLRHLIWQVQLVEKGDFSQEIKFMGEFSQAFNNMLRKLRIRLSELQEHERNLKESEARFKFMANHDPLTGVYNRRSFIELAGVELSNAASLSIPCCLAMMDIDYFKDFNDAYGHLEGDKALRHVVKTINLGLRKNDFAGRYGGEEFIFFFHDANEETGFRVVERLRKLLAETPMLLDGKPVTIYASFGVVGNDLEKSKGKNSIQKLIKKADTALYAAKNAGRNKVIFYSSDLVFPK